MSSCTRRAFALQWDPRDAKVRSDEPSGRVCWLCGLSLNIIRANFDARSWYLATKDTEVLQIQRERRRAGRHSVIDDDERRGQAWTEGLRLCRSLWIAVASSVSLLQYPDRWRF